MIFPIDIQYKKEFILSLLMGISVSTFFWLLEVIEYLASKLHHPEIWFIFPGKIWIFYALAGALLALISWLICYFISKKRSFPHEKLRRVFCLIFFSSFFLLYLYSYSLNRQGQFSFLPDFSAPKDISFFLKIFLLIFLSLMGGIISSLLYKIISNLFRIFLFSVFAICILLMLPLQVININAFIFPKVSDAYKRGPTSKPNVIMITADALRADHLSFMGGNYLITKNIDRIAHEGVAFMNCIIQGSWTIPSMGSIFTSKYPSQHGAEKQDVVTDPQGKIIFTNFSNLLEQNITLAEILSKFGYYTLAFQPNAVVSASAGFSQGFCFYYEVFNKRSLILERSIGSIGKGKIHRLLYPKYIYASDDQILNYLKNWLSHNHDKQFFLSALFFDCHEYYKELDMRKDINEFKRDEKDSLHKFYLSAIENLDNVIGEIYRFLEELGILDNTIIIFHSDHGEEFFDHAGEKKGDDAAYYEGTGHGHTLYDEIIKIPLIIRYPKKIQENFQIKEQTREIDILPTLLSLLDISIDRKFEGMDLTQTNFSPQKSLNAFSESIYRGLEKKSLRTNEWKLIYHPVSERFELYNLKNDPAEKINLIEREQDRFSELKKELFDWIERMSKEKSNVKQIRKLSKQEMEILKSLGYIK